MPPEAQRRVREHLSFFGFSLAARFENDELHTR